MTVYIDKRKIEVIKEIQSVIEEYQACYKELDSYKVAVQIYEIVNPECPICGANLQAWEEMFHETHRCYV